MREIPEPEIAMPIEALAAYLPSDVSWGEPITPALVRHILDCTQIAVPAQTAPVTKGGIRVMVGQVWEDCDPRMGGRRCKVTAIEGEKVVLERVDSYIESRSKVSISRLHKGGGWRLARDVAPAH